MIPRATYIGSVNRGFEMSAECRGSGPSIYISIDNPDANLQRLGFDVPIPVVFRVENGSSPVTDSDSARATARLTGGYMPTTNRVTIGMAFADAAGAISLIEGRARTSGMLLSVEVAETTGTFDLTGAHDIFATFKRACESRKH